MSKLSIKVTLFMVCLFAALAIMVCLVPGFGLAA